MQKSILWKSGQKQIGSFTECANSMHVVQVELNVCIQDVDKKIDFDAQEKCLIFKKNSCHNYIIKPV